MADSLYTNKQYAQFRGPTTSDNYNERIEKLYKDLVQLTNKTGLAEESARLIQQTVYKHQFSLMQALLDLEDRVEALENDQKKVVFRTDSQIDTTRFDTTDYEVTVADRLFHDAFHGLVTLPKVVSSSASKLHFVNGNGEVTLPSTFEAIAAGDNDTADNQSALIDTTDLYTAFLVGGDTVWERNVVVDAPDPDGAVVSVYVRMPIDLMLNNGSNAIIVNPYPFMGCEIVGVYYSTQNDVTLSDADNYIPVNTGGIHSGNPLAIGWIAPGSWVGDEIVDAGPKAFYFDPKDVTAVKVVLRQRSYFTEDGKYVYSYGLSDFDVRYEKFLDSGKAIFRFDAPQGETISSVDNVLPQIWNISEAQLPDVFDYRVIWETSADSGVYTATPVPFSSRVWIEVTLNKSIGGGTPALSGLVVSYS